MSKNQRFQLSGRVTASFLTLIILAFLFGMFYCSKKEKSISLFYLKWEKHQNNPIITKGYKHWSDHQLYPGSILKVKNKYYMWLYGRDKNKKFQIGLKESKDGIVWENKAAEPVLLPGNTGEWDDHQVSKPCVRITKDRKFEMWYIGESIKDGKLIPGIGKASSDDGISWEKFQYNPIFSLPQLEMPWANFLRYFWMLKDEDGYKLWFSAVGKDDYANVETIGYAKSSDGLSWKVYPEPVLRRDSTNVWEDFYVSNPMVMKKNDIYYMFYGGLGKYGFLFQEYIGIARSADGIQWEKYYDNPILISTLDPVAWDKEFVTQPRVLEISNDQFYLWYLGANEKNTAEKYGTYHIGLAIGQSE